MTARLLSEELEKDVGVEKTDTRAEIATRWQIWRQEKSKRAQDSRSGALSSAALFAALNETAPDNAIFSCRCGKQYLCFRSLL